MLTSGDKCRENCKYDNGTLVHCSLQKLTFFRHKVGPEVIQKQAVKKSVLEEKVNLSLIDERVGFRRAGRRGGPA